MNYLKMKRFFSLFHSPICALFRVLNSEIEKLQKFMFKISPKVFFLLNECNHFLGTEHSFNKNEKK